MKILLPISPVSINAAFHGRHVKTDICIAYENALRAMMPITKTIAGDYYALEFTFYLKNFELTDEDNLVKVVQDMVVKSNLIIDDRRVISHKICKIPADQDFIKIKIKAVRRPKAVKSSKFIVPNKFNRIMTNYNSIKASIKTSEKWRIEHQKKRKKNGFGMMFYDPKN